MRTITQAIKIVFCEQKNILLGIASALFFGSIFLFGTGMITFFPTGPYIEFIPTRIATLVVLTILSGITVPVQLYAIKKARAGLKEGASGIGGAFRGNGDHVMLRAPSFASSVVVRWFFWDATALS